MPLKMQMMPSEPEEQGISSSFAAHFFLAPARVVQMMLCCATFVSSQSCIYFFFNLSNVAADLKHNRHLETV